MRNTPPALPVWPIAAAAAALGVSAAELAHRTFSGPQTYVQFTVGAITWQSAAKNGDYALLGALLAAGAGGAALLRWLACRLDARHGQAAAEAFTSALGFCALPAIAWAGANLIGAAIPLHFVRITSMAVVLTVITALVSIRRRQRLPDIDMESPLPVVLTSALVGALALPATAFAINRLLLVAGRMPIWQGRPSAAVLAILGGGSAAAVAMSMTFESRLTRARHLLALLQAPLPWVFLVLVPPPWIDRTGVLRASPVWWFPAVSFVLVAVGSVDLLRRWLQTRGDGAAGRWMHVLSPICLSAVVLVVLLPLTPPAYVSPDDYHFGEWLVPWWSWSSEGLLPFRDYVPARGLVNYTDGVVAGLLGDSSAACIQASVPIVMGTWFLAAVVATAGVVGTLPAIATFALMPLVDRVTDIDLAMTALLMVAWRTFNRTSSTRWWIGWLVAAPIAFLFAPGQGLLVIAATAPLAAWQLGRAILVEPRRLRRAMLWTVALFALVLSVTPLGSMMLGAWRYVGEHTEIASVAHGVEWQRSVNTQGRANYWYWEAVRSSFIAVPIVCVTLLARRLLDRDWTGAARVAVVALPVLVLGVLYIPRAAGRIAPATPSRLWLASIWMYAALLPAVLHAAWGSRRWPAILAITSFAMGALSSMFGGPGLQAFEERARPMTPMHPALIEGEALGLPALGLAIVDPGQLTRLTHLRPVIDALLDRTETYLDLTNRGAHYFYLDRRPPIESGATYNLPNERQQTRAIRRLERENVPLVLARADSILHDGGPPSLRDHAFYRYTVQRYAPVRIDGYLFLIRPDRLGRLGTLAGHEVVTSDPAALLDEAFAPPALERIPVAWGASWDRLQNDAAYVRKLKLDAAGGLIPSGPFAGREAGLLALDLACGGAGRRFPAMTVSWSGDIPGGEVRFAGGPRLVVPLDASPRWLLARQITALQLRAADNTTCLPVGIRRVELWQRRIAVITDAK